MIQIDIKLPFTDYFCRLYQLPDWVGNAVGDEKRRNGANDHEYRQQRQRSSCHLPNGHINTLQADPHLHESNGFTVLVNRGRFEIQHGYVVGFARRIGITQEQMNTIRKEVKARLGRGQG